MFLWILSRYSISYWVEIHSAVDEMESENTLMEHDIHRIVYVLSDYKAWFISYTSAGYTNIDSIHRCITLLENNLRYETND